MDAVATWIGYAVMTAAGLAVAALLVGIALEQVWQRYKGFLNGMDFRQAALEWKRAHPDRWARNKARNGND